MTPGPKAAQAGSNGMSVHAAANVAAPASTTTAPAPASTTNVIASRMAASPASTSKYGWGATPRVYAARKGACVGIYGAGKSGKTSTIGNVIQSELARPLLILSANANPDSLASLDTEEIEVIPITKFEEIDNYYKRIVAEQGKFPFRSVSLDVVSDMLGLREEAGKVKATTDYWQEYSSVNADMKGLTRKWRVLTEMPNLMLNVFFVLWERREDVKIRGVKPDGGRAGLDLNGAMRSSFPGMVPFLGHLTEGDTAGLVRLLDLRTAPLEHVGGWNLDQRTGADPAIKSIPSQIYFGVNDAPMADLVNSIKGGELFPSDRYTLAAASARARGK